MPLVGRVALVLGLLLLATFCGVGFLATFEPPGYPVLRAVYGAGVVLGLAGGAWTARRRGSGSS